MPKITSTNKGKAKAVGKAKGKGKGKGKEKASIEGWHTTDAIVSCEICGKDISAFGIGQHRKTCLWTYEQLKKYKEREAKRVASSPMGRTPKRSRHNRQYDPEVIVPHAPLFGAEAGPSMSGEHVFGDIDPFPPHAGLRASGHGESPYTQLPEDVPLHDGSEPGPSTPPNLRHEPHAPTRPPHNTPAPQHSHLNFEISPHSPHVPPTTSSQPPDASHTITAPLYSSLDTASSLHIAEPDDIKVEYHHGAGRASSIYAFDDFKRDATATRSPPAGQPWVPFGSLAEFEFAELTHEANLSKRQVKRLLKLVDKIASRKDRFSFKTPEDVDIAWDKAKLRYPTFSQTDITVDYKKVPQNFTLHSRSLWEWLLLQIQDPFLAPYFQWDAQRLSKFNGDKWVRFFDEPWTADKFAQVQENVMRLNPNAKPLAIILWADTSKLSTLGSQKGHFIVARIGNLPEHIRNGGFLGGGRIVGFLPIVDDIPSEAGKSRYVDFKSAVYHEAFRAFLADVATLADVGYSTLCGDGITRTLFPYIHLISADYEEQIQFALNRGLKGLFPCTVCRIPREKLSDITAEFPLRIGREAQEVYMNTANLGNKREALKQMGMRLVKNAFWDIRNTDIHEAMSFDRLHAYVLGLWQKHLFAELKDIVTNSSRSVQTRIEERVLAYPKWSKLARFKNLMKLEFTDGNKWEDVSKIIVHVSYEVFEDEDDEQALVLLCLIRRWQELNMLLSLKVQTEDTIAAFNRTLLRFHQAVENYRDTFDPNLPEPKDWNFIKIHSHTHAARDIRLKGAINNMDTKPNERLNGAMRKAYQLRTNFKNVEVQLGEHEDRTMVSTTIRAHIEAAEVWAKEAAADPDQLPDEEDDNSVASAWTFGAIYLGSRRKAVPIGSLLAEGGDDRAFVNFIPKVQVCIEDLVRRDNGAAYEDDSNVSSREMLTIPRVGELDLITECRYVKVSYENKVDWRLDTNSLRCNPMCHGLPRYDFALLHWTFGDITTPTVCRLIRLFVYSTNGKKYPLALVQLLNQRVEPRPWDSSLGLCRVREQSRDRSMVVPARSLIRGVVAVQDNKRKDQYTVMDTLDGDIFLRLMPLFSHRAMEIIQN